jgi:hypothetical protein
MADVTVRFGVPLALPLLEPERPLQPLDGGAHVLERQHGHHDGEALSVAHERLLPVR